MKINSINHIYYFYIIIFSFLAISCTNNEAKILQQDPSYTKYISGFTDGIVSNQTEIIIELKDNLTNNDITKIDVNQLFEFSPKLNADDILINKLKSLDNVTIITNVKTTRIIGNGEKVTSMEYEDRSNNEIKSLKLEGVFVQIGLVPNSGFIKGLVETNKYGEILVSEKNRTNIDKIYAAGDVTNVPYKQIIIAMGEGAKVGLTAFEDLMIA